MVQYLGMWYIAAVEFLYSRLEDRWERAGGVKVKDSRFPKMGGFTDRGGGATRCFFSWLVRCIL